MTNGNKGITIGALIAILSIAGSAVGVTVWVSKADETVERNVVARCRAALEDHEEREAEIYARATDVAVLVTKIDNLSTNIAVLNENLREFRTETRAALSRRRGTR
jgi:hypothetical protein